jgi:hypothetical protein
MIDASPTIPVMKQIFPADLASSFASLKAEIRHSAYGIPSAISLLK